MDCASCLSATELRTITAKRDDFRSKSLFLVKNKGQWNAKSGPKAAYGNFAMRTKFCWTFGFEIIACGQKLVTFCTHTHAAKLVVEMLGPRKYP